MYSAQSNALKTSSIAKVLNSEIVRTWGFYAEDYRIYTEDGYEILIVRAYKEITQATPLVFGHGISTNSISYVLRQHKSFVHYVCSRGFDVWLINFRGTRFSRGHVTLSAKDKRYWKFSFVEMAQYDLPAALQLVGQVTGRKSVYVGFSLGTTVSYVYASSFPRHAESYLEGIVSMAPVAYLKGIKSVLKLLTPFSDIIRNFAYNVFHGELLEENPLVYQLCGQTPRQFIKCQRLRGLLFGSNLREVDPAYQPLIYKVIMDSVGVEVLSHFSQLINTGKFENKDHGKARNIRIYGSPTPPSFDLSRIPVPVSLFYADNDLLATEKNVKRLYSELSPSSRCGLDRVNLKGFSHSDFLEAKHITTLILEPLYQKILKIINRQCYMQ